MHTVTLTTGREKSLLRRHPWIFSGAVAPVQGHPDPGDTVSVRSHAGQPLGRGAWSPRSQIRVRMWTFDPDQEVDGAFFRTALERALAGRQDLLASDLTACRLVNAESDGLPGLVVDRYGDVLVCQFLSVGAEHWKSEVVRLLAELVRPRTIFERSDDSVRAKEGLGENAGVLFGEEPPELVEILENGCRFLVDVRQGHKTGFYLDQRDNRAALARMASGAEVLNAFSYTGGFGVAALKAGARRVMNVDSSTRALELARLNAAGNGLDPDSFETRQDDVFRFLRQEAAQGSRYDIAVLDPPKFAESKDQVMRASRGYKDINRLASTLLRPGGLLFTFSCSGLLETSLFQKIVADGVLDAGRTGQILYRLSQAACHPTTLAFPEGTYLKGLICRIL